MTNKLSSIFVLLLVLIIAFITYWLKIEVEKELLIKKIIMLAALNFILETLMPHKLKKMVL